MKYTATAMAVALSATAAFPAATLTIALAHPYSHLLDGTYEASMPAFHDANTNIEVTYRPTPANH